jgi:hypothetical protein
MLKVQVVGDLGFVTAALKALKKQIDNFPLFPAFLHAEMSRDFPLQPTYVC